MKIDPVNFRVKVTSFKLIDKAQQKAQGSCEIYPLRLSELVVVHWTYFCHKKLEACLYLLKTLSELPHSTVIEHELQGKPELAF